MCGTCENEAARCQTVGKYGGRLAGPLGVMGAFMQPQGHLQVFLALALDGCGPQAALDRLLAPVAALLRHPLSPGRRGFRDRGSSRRCGTATAASKAAGAGAEPYGSTKGSATMRDRETSPAPA